MPAPHDDGRRGRWLVLAILGISAILAAIAFQYRTSAWRVGRPPSTEPTPDSVQHLSQ